MSRWKIAFEVEVDPARNPRWALAAATDACDDNDFRVVAETVEFDRVPPLRLVPDKSYRGSE